MLTVASVVLFTTLVFGTICKSLNICTKNNIPLQNLVIGILAGILCYFIDVVSNIFEAVILCVISSLSAGGIYDFSRAIRRKK